jgi:glycosyltransferase involved in cell wall biosynthesis
MNKLKIAIIFPKDSEAMFNKESTRTFGGASVQMYLIAKELNRYKNKGIKTFSFINDYNFIDFKEIKRFNLVKTYKEKDNPFKKIYKLKQKLDEIKPDVIIQHGLTFFSGLLAHFCRKKGIKFIFMFASDKEVKGRYQSSGRKCFTYKLLLKNSILITQNSFQKSSLISNYKRESNLIYNGFNIPKFTTKEKINQIVWVSRCDRLKNPNLFIEISKDNKNEALTMICSPSENKEFYESIKMKSNQINNLRFLSFVPFRNINHYFEEAKILVNTSDYEGFPQTFIQATMNATPIVSLNVNPDNFINKYRCGFCSNGDFELMKKQIKQLLKDKRLYTTMSNNAYDYFRKNHDLKLKVQELLKVIRK